MQIILKNIKYVVISNLLTTMEFPLIYTPFCAISLNPFGPLQARPNSFSASFESDSQTVVVFFGFNGFRFLC